MAEAARPLGAKNPAAFLFGRGSLYTIAKTAQMAAVLLVTPLATRMLSSDAFGTLATATRVGQVVAVLAGFGLPGGLARLYFDRNGPTTARRLVVSTLGVAVAIALVLHLTGPLWSKMFEGLHYGGPLVVAVWMGVPVAMLEASQVILRNQDDAAGFVAAAIIASAIGQLAGLLAVWSGAGPTGYLIGVACATAVAAVVAAVRGGVIGARPAPMADVVAALRIGGPTVPHLLALLVIAVGDRVVIERVLGLADVARYEIAYQIGALPIVVLGALNNVWAPMIYSAGDHERWSVLATTTRAIEYCAVPFISFICFTAPLGIAILAPSSYELVGLPVVSAVVAGATILFVRYLANVHVVFQLKRTLVMAWATPISAVVNIVFAVALARLWGLVGCALATVIAYGTLAALTGRVAHHHVAVPWHHRSTMTAVAFTTTVVVVTSLVPSGGLVGIGVRAVGAVLSAIVLAVVGRRVVAESAVA